MIQHAKADVISNPMLVASWNAYEAVVHHEQLLFLTSRESPQTKEIDDCDTGRDGILREIHRQLLFHSKSQDADISHAAKVITHVVKPYDKAHKLALYEETSYIRNMLDDLGEAANAALIALLPGFPAMLANLATFNNRLDELYIERNLALDEIAKLGKRVDVRHDADAALYNLVDDINAVYKVNALGAKDPAVSAPLERVESIIRTITAKLEAVMARRHHHKPAAAPDKPGETPPAAPPAPPTDPQNPDNTLPQAPDTPPQTPDVTPPAIDPDELNPPAVGERIVQVNIKE
jgi:hypothetical protein